MIHDLNFEKESDRRTFLMEFETQYGTQGYPQCEPDLIYTTLDATFVRDLRVLDQYDGYRQDLQATIDEVLEPVRSHKENLNQISREEASVLATIPFLRESISSFTEMNDEPVHGGDLANEFISASERNRAHESLRDFQDWYAEDLKQLLAREGTPIELGDYTFPRDEFYDEALYNGLRMVLDRREAGERFTTREVQMP